MSLQVYVNGLELCTFKHRIPLENITALAICGDVSINFIGFIEASYPCIFLNYVFHTNNIVTIFPDEIFHFHFIHWFYYNFIFFVFSFFFTRPGNNEITGMRSSTWRDSSDQMISTTSKDF